jgi:hypothetical protein
MQLVSGWSDFWLSGIDLAVGRAAVGGAMGVRKSVYALAAVELEALREAFLAVMGLRDERGYQYSRRAPWAAVAHPVPAWGHLVSALASRLSVLL